MSQMTRNSQIALLLATAAVALPACGGDESAPTDRAQTPPEQTAPGAGPEMPQVADGRIGEATEGGPGGVEVTHAGGPIDLDADDDGTPEDAGVSGSGCADADLAPTPPNRARLARATMCLLNAQRRSRGLPTLRPNARLARSSSGHSTDMVRRRYFAHDTPAGRTALDRIRAAGYVRRGSYRIGENLAWGTGSLGTPQGVIRGWLNSPAHRRIMLSPGFRELGIGVVTDIPLRADGQGATYTANFGMRRG